MSKTFYDWCNEATAKIRFRRDRAEVYQELMHHLTDKREHLIALGYTNADATQAAMEEMGDVQDLCRLLERVHRPFIGWLWVVSRWTVGVMAAIMVIALLGGRFTDLKNMYFFTAYTTYYPEDGVEIKVREGEWRYDPQSYGEKNQLTALMPPVNEVQAGQYTFSIPKAALWHFEAGEIDGDTYEAETTLYFRLVARVKTPWAGTPITYHFLYAQDSLGNHYASAQERNAPSGPRLLGNSSDHTPFRYDFEMWVSDLHPEAEWVDIKYDYLGTSFSLRINLEGGTPS